MTGVVTMPPSAPRLVIVIVDPVSSSRVAFDQHRGDAELRRANGCDVAARPAPDDEQFRVSVFHADSMKSSAGDSR